jgi:hypothetical protein
MKNHRLRIPTAILILAALALLAPTSGPHVADAKGHVEVGRGEPPVWTPAGAGDALAPGDAVRTGDDGRAELDLGRAVVRLYPNSLLRVPGWDPASGEPDEVDLEHGRSLFDVLRRGRAFEVRTPQVVVAVKGTRFSVALGDDDAAVAVYRGLVGVRSATRGLVPETLVREGFAARGSRSFELLLHDGGDPWEAWSVGGTPDLITPEARALPSSAQAALATAREAARVASRPRVVTHAAERHPEVRERLRAARAAHAASRPAPDAKPEREGVDRDAIADARREKLDMRIEEAALETWMNHGMPPAAPMPDDMAPGTSADPYDPAAMTFEFLDGSSESGGAAVMIALSTGESWTVEDDYLKDVLEGETQLPSLLSQILLQQGISEDQFVRNLLEALASR